MKILVRAVVCLALLLLCAVVWYVFAADYGDGVISGTYHLAENAETSTLILKPNHTFRQDLTREGKVEHAEGSWRSFGEAHIAFSKDFLILSGQEPGADGTRYGEIQKRFGFLVSLSLSQYHVLWYGRVHPAPDASVTGTYVGDSEGVTASLTLRPDHTFEQSVSRAGITKRSDGMWSFAKNGDVIFSKQFLKASGEPLIDGETASAWNPQGSNLQIQIAMSSNSAVPTFSKKQFPWQ